MFLAVIAVFLAVMEIFLGVFFCTILQLSIIQLSSAREKSGPVEFFYGLLIVGIDVPEEF